MPPTRYHKMFVIWLSEIEQIQRLLRMFAETITLCYQYIDVGIYDPSHGFIFIVETEELMAEIFRDPFIQKHSKVSAVRRVYDEKQHFINFGHNFFKPGEMKPTYVWSETKKIPNKEAIFTSLDDFQGYEFNVSFTSRNWTKSCCYRLESCPGPTTPWETRWRPPRRPPPPTPTTGVMR